MDINQITVLVVVALVSFLLGTFVYSRGPARNINATVNRLEVTVDRIEKAAQGVARDLAATSGDLHVAHEQRVVQGQTLDRMEDAAHVVADNLADSVLRADATVGPEGAAADAALRTGDSAAAIHKRQDTQPK